MPRSRTSSASAEASRCTQRLAGAHDARARPPQAAEEGLRARDSTTSCTCIRRSVPCCRYSRSMRPTARSSERSTRTSTTRIVYGAWSRVRSRKGWTMLAAAIAVSHSTTVALNRYFEADWTDRSERNRSRPVQSARAAAARRSPTDVPIDSFPRPLRSAKRADDADRAFRKVKGKESRGAVVVVGDGPLRESLLQAAGGDPDITFVGAVLGSRPSYYAHSSIYACPTTKASFGITLLESMACETPVVCSDILGFRDVVEHEREALMFPCGDRGRARR